MLSSTLDSIARQATRFHLRPRPLGTASPGLSDFISLFLLASLLLTNSRAQSNTDITDGRKGAAHSLPRQTTGTFSARVAQATQTQWCSWFFILAERRSGFSRQFRGALHWERAHLVTLGFLSSLPLPQSLKPRTMPGRAFQQREGYLPPNGRCDALIALATDTSYSVL